MGDRDPKVTLISLQTHLGVGTKMEEDEEIQLLPQPFQGGPDAVRSLITPGEPFHHRSNLKL